MRKWGGKSRTEYFNQYMAELDLLSDRQLARRFNGDLGPELYSFARGALKEAFIVQLVKRDFDFTDIDSAKAISLDFRMFLHNKKVYQYPFLN